MMTREEIITRVNEICEKADARLFVEAKSVECLAKINNDACLEYNQLISDIVNSMQEVVQ